MASRTAGFRFSKFDAGVLVGTGVIAALAAAFSPAFAALILFVLLHFFLFCNVFRVRRTKEIAWAVVLIFNMMVWIAAGSFLWWGIALLQLPVTVLVVVLEMRSPTYHGVGARAINKQLDAYLKGTLVIRRPKRSGRRGPQPRKA